MKLIKFTILPLIFLSVFAVAKSASAATFTSTATGGTWATDSTWVGGVAPTSTDDAVIATTGASVVTLGDKATIANVTINSGATLAGSSYNLTVNGDFTNNGTFTCNTSTVTMKGSDKQIAGSSATAFYNLTINSTGTVTVKNSPSVYGNLTITGILSVDSGQTLTFYLGGQDTLTINSSSYLSGAGTIEVNYTFRLDWAIYNLNLSNSGTINIKDFNYVYLAWSFWAGHDVKSVTIPGTTYGDDTTKTNVDINLTGSGASADYTFQLTGDTTIKGNFTIASDGAYGGSDNSTGTLDNATAPNNNRNITVGGNFNIINGYSYYIGGSETITVSGDWTNSGTFTAGTGTVTFDGSVAQTITGATTWYNLTIANTASPSDTNDVDPDAVQTVTNLLLVNDGQWTPYTGDDYAGVTIGASGIMKPDASASITVSGNWSNSGTFIPGSGTVTFDGSGTSTISGNTTFHNLTCATPGKSLIFTDGTTQTIESGGTLTLTGASGSLITLRGSSTAGWNITDSGSESVSYVDVAYSTATNGITASNSKDSGNNVNWDFASQLAFTTTAKTLTAGTVSDAFTVQLQDGTGGATNAVSAITVNLSTTSTGTYQFRASSTGVSTTSVTITIGSSTVDFYYIDYQVGSPTITAAESPSVGLTDATQQQTVNAAAGAASTKWWSTSWRYRRKITFDNSGHSSNLTNFPALVKLTSSNFTYANAQSAGQDIRFMDADQVSELPYEIEKYTTSGDSFIWSRVPQIDASSSTDYIWMYYGNLSATDKQNANSVWDTNFKGVWHLGDAGPTTAADSTSNANTGTRSGGVTFGATGQIDNALSFNGTNYITVSAPNGGSLDIDSNPVTLSAWINPSALGDGENSDNKDIIGRGTFGYNGYGINLNGNLINLGRHGGGNFNSVSTVSTGTWYYIAGVINGASSQIYINGQLNSAGTVNVVATSDSTVGIGFPTLAGLYFSGLIDEVRISNTARSADYIRASYLNQGGTTFLSLGSEQKPKLVFTTSAQTFSTGSCSSIITVQVQDSDNQAIAVPSDITVNLASTSSTGRFSTDGSTWSSDNTSTVTITSGNNSASFYYKDTVAGTYTITAAESPSYGWTDVSQTVTVVAGSFSVVASSSTPVAGSVFTLTVTALDSAGATDANYSGTVNLTVSYNSPSSGSGTLSVTSLSSFSNGVALTTSQAFSDCGTINIVATDSAESTKTGTSSNIDMRPYDFTVVASSLDTSASGSAYARHTVSKPFTLTVTARNASAVTCPNYKGTADLSINYTSPSTSQSGSVGTSSLTSTYWTNGVASFTSQTYNKWGTITITATDATLTTQTGTSANIIFIPKDFSITLSDPSASRTYYYTNEGFSATVTARDYNASTVSNYAGTITFTGSGLTLPSDYTFTSADSGSHKFTGINGSSETSTALSIKDTTYTSITGTSSAITLKAGTIKVISNSGPVGSISVQVKILDSSGNVLTEDDSTTFTVTITEFMKDNNSCTSTATSTAATVTDGIATITVKDTEPETVTVTPSASPTMTAVSGTVRFGTVSGSGVGIQLWREIRGPSYEEEKER